MAVSTINFNKIVPIVSHKSPSQPYWAAAGSGGGGGGGSTIMTSSITTSTITTQTITAQGPIVDFLASPSVPSSQWSVGLDGTGNAADVLKNASTLVAYRDTAIADSTGAEVQLIREEVALAYGQIGYITNPAAPAETGLRFLSSLNGGVDATALISSTDYYPLGNTVIPFATLSAEAPAGSGAVLTGSIPVVPGHLYNIAFQVSEAVTGVPNPQDRVSYTIAGQVLDTIPHTEISTLQAENPRGRCVTGVFVPPTNTVQLAVGNNSLSLESTIVTCIDTYLTGVMLNDMGPSIVLP